MSSGLSPEKAQTIREIGSRAAGELGLELVDMTIGRARTRWHLRLFIDRAGPVGVGLDECKQVSNAAGKQLEEQDLIPGSYVLEVSSPGLDRPIRSVDDVRRNSGRRIVVETREPVEGRRTFQGLLVESDDGSLHLKQDDGVELVFPLEQVAKARQEAAF